MNASLQVILVWMLTTFASYSIPLVSCSHGDDRIITIDKAGVSSIECCVYGKCHCSNLSLALEHIQSNTDIRIMSTTSLLGTPQLEGVNDNNFTMEIFQSLTDVYEVSPLVWLHKFILQFSHIITDCVNNLYGPAQVFTCCDDYSCDKSYEYIVDSTHNNITMISNDTIASCPFGEVCTFQVVGTANVNSTSVSTHIRISPSTCGNDIAHVFCNDCQETHQCLPLLCNFSYMMIPKGINCVGSESYDYFTVTPGYWYSNGFTKYVTNCPHGHHSSSFDLYSSIHDDAPYPNSNSQCSINWTGLACGECVKGNYIMHDSTRCVALQECIFKNYGLIPFFFLSLLYWIIVISLIFVLLHFKFDITAGYAYGMIFYYSVLEQTVNASYVGTQNNLKAHNVIHIHNTLLTILSSIGNMKPPFQLFKFCFEKNTKMMDHMFLTYIHPLIVIFWIVTIFMLARNFVTVARTIGRYVNSKSICILLMLSYSSISYTSVQLFRPLAVYNQYDHASWQLYLSPTIQYFDNCVVILYFIIAILCELIIGIGFPFVLAFEPYLTHYLNINFSSIYIKPIMDQSKGCYKEEYRWFAAYYLLCRQLLYAADIGTDFMPYYISKAKFPIMLAIYVLIIMVHVWFQPYKQRILNVLDSSILMTLMLVLIGEHIAYNSTVVLWSFPLVLFINCVAFSTKFKHLLIPISCLGIIALSCLEVLLLPDYFTWNQYVNDYSFYYISFCVILPIASLVFLAYMIYLFVIVIKRCCCKPQAHYRLINEQNEDSHEDSDSSNELHSI